MGNLAQIYTCVGRNADALAMFEQTLEFQRRMLPANHPEIGEGVRAAWGGMRCDDVTGLIFFNLTCRLGHEQPC